MQGPAVKMENSVITFSMSSSDMQFGRSRLFASTSRDAPINLYKVNLNPKRTDLFLKQGV